MRAARVNASAPLLLLHQRCQHLVKTLVRLLHFLPGLLGLVFGFPEIITQSTA